MFVDLNADDDKERASILMAIDYKIKEKENYNFMDKEFALKTGKNFLDYCKAVKFFGYEPVAAELKSDDEIDEKKFAKGHSIYFVLEDLPENILESELCHSVESICKTYAFQKVVFVAVDLDNSKGIKTAKEFLSDRAVIGISSSAENLDKMKKLFGFKKEKRDSYYEYSNSQCTIKDYEILSLLRPSAAVCCTLDKFGTFASHLTSSYQWR